MVRAAMLRAAVLLAAMALPACGRGGKSEPAVTAARPAWAYDKWFNQGAPVSLAIRLDRVEATLADRILMEEELSIEEGFEADFPEYLPEDFEGFSVVDMARDPVPARPPAAESPAPVQRQGGEAGRPASRRRRLTLEPDQSGELAIAPLAVYFHRAGEEAETSFLTDEIPLQIAGIEDAAALSVRGRRGIFEAPPSASSRGALLWAAASASALALGAGGLYYLKRRPRQAPPPVPPHEIAYEALRRLLALNLIEKGESELFFVHLSSILRDYIENRFQVRAPERTTEEFLVEAAQDPALSLHHHRLGQFLALSDQVKFALYRPNEAAIQGSFDAVKQFLEETKPREP